MQVPLLTKKSTSAYCMFQGENLVTERVKNKIEYLVQVQKLNSKPLFKVCVCVKYALNIVEETGMINAKHRDTNGPKCETCIWPRKTII